MPDKKAKQILDSKDTLILKPSVVLRRVKARAAYQDVPNVNDLGVLNDVQEGRIACAKCRKVRPKVTTCALSFWENGMYVFCGRCRQATLALPIFEDLVIDLSGERKKYPLVREVA